MTRDFNQFQPYLRPSNEWRHKSCVAQRCEIRTGTISQTINKGVGYTMLVTFRFLN